MAPNARTILITGAARGIGEGLAREMARRGYRVSLVGLEFERLKMVASEINEAWRTGHSRAGDDASDVAVAFEADVTNSAQLDRAVAGTIEKFGRINVVVANAGIASFGSFAATHVEDLVRVVDVNLNGVLRTMKSTYEALLDSRGYALVISSASAFPALPKMSAYGASKAGVEHLANNLRVEMSPFGVDVGVAYPSWVDTDLVRDLEKIVPDIGKVLLHQPKFLGPVTPLDECVTILAEAIELRKRRVYIPDWIAALHAMRSVAVSGLADLVVGFFAKRLFPSFHEPSLARGEAFGPSSVEAQRTKR